MTIVLPASLTKYTRFPAAKGEALKDAADEDRGTGGVDLERNIYPSIKTCTARGIETIADEEIARLHRDVLEQRRRRAAGA